MTDYLVSPEWPIEIEGKRYTLDCSFRTLKAIQHAFEKDILDVLTDVSSMRFDQHARLVEIGINGSGEKSPSIDVIEQAIVDEIGIGYIRHVLNAWLIISVSPKKDRPKKAKQVTELLQKMKEGVDSLGEITSSSA